MKKTVRNKEITSVVFWMFFVIFDKNIIERIVVPRIIVIGIITECKAISIRLFVKMNKIGINPIINEWIMPEFTIFIQNLNLLWFINSSLVV